MKAEQVFPAIQALINQLQDSGERQKLETMILGAVESHNKSVDRISAMLDKYPRYQIKPKSKKK